jgi:two-component system response regulator VicR
MKSKTLKSNNLQVNNLQAKNLQAKILLVEDDQFFARVLIRQLVRGGYQVTYCKDGEDGLQTFQNHTFDLCIIDILMPIMDGFQLTQAIRTIDKNVPILIISSRHLEQDRIYGFEIGCDDYIIKPFNLEELLLRIEVFLKRCRTLQCDRLMIYNIGGLTFNFSERKILHSASNICIQLPPKEAELLLFLCENANKRLGRSNILMTVWGCDDFFAGRSMDVYLTRLRKHFSLDPSIRLETFHGHGFMLITNSDDPGACLVNT